MAARITLACSSRAYGTTVSSYTCNSCTAQRIFHSQRVRWYSSQQSPKFPVGSPSAENIRPGEPEYSIFMENALNPRKKWELFTTPRTEDSDEAIKSLMQISEKNQTALVQLPAKSLISLFREMSDLRERVTQLEGRITKA